MENPNTYDDDAYTMASTKAHSAISALWEAGASLDNIRDVIENALADCDLEGVSVDIDASV